MFNLLRRLGRRFSNYQFWLYCNLLRPVFLSVEAIEQYFRGNFSHAVQRLAHGGQRWRVEHCRLNVVEADHRDIFGDAQSRFANRANRANGRCVVIGKQCGEGVLTLQQHFGVGIAKSGAGLLACQLDGQLRTNCDSQFTSNF